MGQTGRFRLTIYLGEEAKHKTSSYEMWSSLTALDVCVLETYDKSGAISGEWARPLSDVLLLERIPGVVSVTARVIPIEEYVTERGSSARTLHQNDRWQKVNSEKQKQRRISVDGPF